MLIPLVILAVLSVCGGWVGINSRFENFLAPVFHPAGVTMVGGESGTTESQSAAPELKPEEAGNETLLMAVSVFAGLAGLFLAWILYYRRPQLPQQIAQVLGGFYQAVLNKYWVDELYAAVFVKPLVDGSTRILWRGIDQGVIDATLDNSADGAREVSDTMRHMQSGNLRSYAGWVAAGAAVVIGYMIWMGTR